MTAAGGFASVKQSKLCHTDTVQTTYSCSLGSTVAAGNATVVLIGSAVPTTVTSGYTLVGTAYASPSTISAYYDAAALQTITVTYSGGSDVHIAMFEIANGGKPTGFSSAKGSTAPSITASANSIVVDMFGEQYGYPYYGTVPSGWNEYYPPGTSSNRSAANELDSLIFVGATAGTAYSLNNSPYLISASFEIPTQASATPSPAYDSLKKVSPAGGSYSYYPTSVFHKTIPASPVFVSAAQSSSWNSMQASDNFMSITASEDGSNVNDGSDPTTYTNGDGTGYVLNCNKYSYSQYSCQSSSNVRNINGATVKFPLGVITEGSSDHHVVNIDVAAGIEDDIWEGRPLPNAAGGTWSVGGGGECSLSGNGVGCGGSVATNMANSLGLVRAEDILYCLQSSPNSSSCTLPYALSIALACNGNGVEYPATGSDAQCFGNQGTSSTRIAEGTRGCLKLTDAQINAASYRPDEKVIYRTMDCSHYGVFDRDSAYSAGPGLQLQWQGGQAYAAFGETDPWKTLAGVVGISVSNTADYVFPITMTQPPFAWCANGNNDGLCD